MRHVYHKHAFRRISALLASTLFLLATTGCWVQSVYPFYEDADVIEDTNLTGNWIGDGELKGCLLDIALTGKTYTIALSGTESKTDSETCAPSNYAGTLIQLGQQRFVDVMTDPDNHDNSNALEMILKVDGDKQKLALTPLDGDWTENALDTKSVKLAGRSQTFGSGILAAVRVTLVSPTSDLRQFLLEHGNDKRAFSESGQMRFRRK